jgi:hypothetical protein
MVRRRNYGSPRRSHRRNQAYGSQQFNMDRQSMAFNDRIWTASYPPPAYDNIYETSMPINPPPDYDFTIKNNAKLKSPNKLESNSQISNQAQTHQHQQQQPSSQANHNSEITTIINPLFNPNLTNSNSNMSPEAESSTNMAFVRDGSIKSVSKASKQPDANASEQKNENDRKIELDKSNDDHQKS